MAMAKAQRRIAELAEAVGEALLARRMWLATAESCTAGGVAYAVTQVAGSSQWYDRGFVTYSNAAKRQMLGVSATDLPVVLPNIGRFAKPNLGFI